MAGKKKSKGKLAEKISKKKTITSKFDDKFGGDPIKQLDSLFGSLRPVKKKNMGGAIMKNRGGTFKGTY
jgi:hypothetical protein